MPGHSLSRLVRHLHLSRLKRNWDVRQRGLAPESSSHKSPLPNAAIGFSGSIFAISQFAFNFDVCAFLQAICLFRQLVPADDAMPFRARLVFVAVLFPTHPSRKREPSVSIAVRCGAALRVRSRAHRWAEHEPKETIISTLAMRFRF